MSDAEKLLEELSFAQKFKKDFLTKEKIFLWGGVHDDSAKEVVNQLLYLENLDPGKEITFYINSPGGVVTSGMIVYDCMKMMKSPVNTVCIGLAASMGSIPLSGGTKGKRNLSAESHDSPTCNGGTFKDKQVISLFTQNKSLKRKRWELRFLLKTAVFLEKIYEDLKETLMNANESLEWNCR